MSNLDAKLFKAVKDNNIQKVKNLITKGVDINSLHKYEFFLYTPLHLAASKNYKEIADALLEQDGIDVNAKDKFEKTPLHLATIYKSEEVLHALLEQDGININAKDSNGNTPLDYADVMGYQDIADILKEKESAIDITNKNENILLLITDKETQPDTLDLLDKDESDIQLFNDVFSFGQDIQSEQLF